MYLNLYTAARTCRLCQCNDDARINKQDLQETMQYHLIRALPSSVALCLNLTLCSLCGWQVTPQEVDRNPGLQDAGQPNIPTEPTTPTSELTSYIGGTHLRPESSHNTTVNDVNIVDLVVGRGLAAQVGSSVTVWYWAKVVESNYKFEDVNSSNSEPVNHTFFDV